MELITFMHFIQIEKSNGVRTMGIRPIKRVWNAKLLNSISGLTFQVWFKVYKLGLYF